MEYVLGNLPMFLDEQPLAFKIMAQYGHDTELSPKTYCEVAGEKYHSQHHPSQRLIPPPPPLPPSFSFIGRGIEYANARSKHCYRNRCTHIIKEMENEIRCLPFTIFYFSPVHSLQLSLQLLAFNYAGNILHVLYFTIF